MGGCGDVQSPSFHTLIPHRQSYFIFRDASRTNKNPFSPTNGQTSYSYDIDPLEAKFQLSFKAEVPENVNPFSRFFRLWGAYTQQSNWQMLNSRNSSPFRASNYEPELIATHETEQGSPLKLVNFGLVHQSNGQAGPESRSWNRLYVQGGWEWENRRTVSVLARGWWRIPESILKDDNPDIKSYLGYGDVVVRLEGSVKNITTVLLRNNLSLNQNRGFVQLDYAYPLRESSAYYLHFQGLLGYGETLIDYNHHQKAIGIGLSFRD
ncbi:MAG: phospholipase A [Betaproteobacteria bacterium]|nr:phospholipase A [Betaproteobacteria bacterium]